MVVLRGLKTDMGKLRPARLFNPARRISSEPYSFYLLPAMPTFPLYMVHSKAEVYYTLLHIFAFPFEVRILL